MRSRRARSLLVSVLLGLALVGLEAPAASAAGDQLQEASVRTYELQPQKGVIHVTEVLTLTNKAPSRTKRYACTGWAFDPYVGYYSYDTTCTSSTDYYYNSYSMWAEQDARAFKIKGSSGSASVRKSGRDGDFRKIKITYSPLWYGRTRKLTLQYDLPAGGPRSTKPRRVGYAFSQFCAVGPGTDKGEVRIVVPSGYELTGAGSMKMRASGGKQIYSSGLLKSKPWTFSACVEGTNPKGYTSTEVAQAGGGPVTIESWKEDKAWRAAMTLAVTEDLPKLAALLGDRSSNKALVVREGLAGPYATNPYDPATGRLMAGEGVTTRDAARHALTATWFDSSRIQSGWLKEGYIRWAERAAGTSDAACSKPGPAPTSTARLATWTATGGSFDTNQLAEWKSQAACYVVATVNDAIGAERVAAILAMIRDGMDPWAPDGTTLERRTKVVGWQGWLDIVTEAGLLPAGADPELAAGLVTEYGVTADADLVAAHSAARDAYHALEAMTGGRVPTPATEAMRVWHLDEATAAIAAARTAWETAASVETIVPAVDTDGGTVQAAVLAATTQQELDAAVALGERQVAAAKTAAEALALKASPRDTLQELGLVGTVVPADDAAVAAVEAIDPAAADAAAAEIHAALDGAKDAGMQRAAIGGGALVALLALIGGLVFVVRRRRVSSAAALASAAPSGAPQPPHPPRATG